MIKFKAISCGLRTRQHLSHLIGSCFCSNCDDSSMCHQVFKAIKYLPGVPVIFRWHSELISHPM